MTDVLLNPIPAIGEIMAVPSTSYNVTEWWVVSARLVGTTRSGERTYHNTDLLGPFGTHDECRAARDRVKELKFLSARLTK